MTTAIATSNCKENLKYNASYTNGDRVAEQERHIITAMAFSRISPPPSRSSGAAQNIFSQSSPDLQNLLTIYFTISTPALISSRRTSRTSLLPLKIAYLSGMIATPWPCLHLQALTPIPPVLLTDYRLPYDPTIVGRP
jgi:hypothetical protein